MYLSSTVGTFLPSLAPALGEGELAPEASLEDLPPEGLFLPKSGIVVTLSEIHSKPNFVHMRHFLCCQLFLSSVSATVLLLCSDVLSLLLYLKDLPVALRLVLSSCSTWNRRRQRRRRSVVVTTCTLQAVRCLAKPTAESTLPSPPGATWWYCLATAFRETRPSGPKHREGRAS